MTSEVDPEFGSLKYWSVAKNAPIAGSLADRAGKLWSIAQRERAYQKGKGLIPSRILKGLAVELAAAFAMNGQAMTPDMLRLLAWAADVPLDFLRDPATFYSGYDGKGQGVDLEMKHRALRLEIEHIRRHGAKMPVNALAREVDVSRKSIGNWRKQDPGYRDLIDLFMSLSKNHPQAEWVAKPGWATKPVEEWVIPREEDKAAAMLKAQRTPVASPGKK